MRTKLLQHAILVLNAIAQTLVMKFNFSLVTTVDTNPVGRFFGSWIFIILATIAFYFRAPLKTLLMRSI